ncbi:MAG: hypothetical protein KY475_00855 [Planctomycetes bacterium]|nr:hypothetical protein [Planctomycetota bacterium]
MRAFRVAVYGRPTGAAPGPKLSLNGGEVETLRLMAAPAPLPVTFEEAEAALSRLPRLYFEPDGSFGWYAPPDDARWEVGGMLYDRGECVAYAELRGTCTAAAFRELLDALGQSRSPLLVQILTPGAFLDPEEFCRLL